LKNQNLSYFICFEMLKMIYY